MGGRVWRPAVRQGAAFVAVLAVTAAILHAMGRSWVCGGGEPWYPWSGDIWSRHNSQHLFDPYAATHVLHGILLYAGLWLALGSRTSRGARLWIAIAIEAAWEVIENTPMVIDRYRETTLALGYSGDSVINSLADILSLVAGYWLAAWLPVWASAAVFVAVEAVLLVTIRDSLVLNVIQLLTPFEALKEWQMGGRP
ncbi:MAG TPA: DUF2585 family protein [Gammaproteobacteria bacterium]|nr:DUF2585 family protein [Gammaproteobacteria bacterium]